MPATTETKTADALLFGHYLRTGQRLSGAAAEQFLEHKFNQRHYRENGQFARAGEGVNYGGGAPSSPNESARQARGSGTAQRQIPTLRTNDRSANRNEEIVVIGDPKLQKLRDAFDATFGGQQQTPKRAPLTRRQPSGSLQGSPSLRELGSLSTQYETGGRGVSTVSSGIGRNGVPDRGGVSYGSYQMTSQDHKKEDGTIRIIRNGGNVARFLQTDGKQWAPEFAGHAPGSPGFTGVWRRIAQRDGTALHNAEHAWVKRTSYDPAVSIIKSTTRLDIDQAAPALRDVLWSTAVQHGAGSLRTKNGAAQIFVDAIATTDLTNSRSSPGYVGELVKNTYKRRTAYWRSDRVRYLSEMRNALVRLRSE